MSPSIQQDALFIPVNDTDTLHLKRFFCRQEGPPVFMLHGAIENGKIFYPRNGSSLAVYLAQHGFDVYVGDLRGRGLSHPAIGRNSNYGQTESITEDIPAFMGRIREIRGNTSQHWIAHSWGGVLMASYLARFPESLPLARSMVCFGTKRTIRVRNLKKFLSMDLFWKRAGRGVVGLYGYLPAKAFRFGSDNETNKSHLHVMRWVEPSCPWVDPQDAFDYGSAAKKIAYPPTLHFAGVNDRYLGNPKDVADFILETDPKKVEYRVLSRKEKNLHDYGHVDMLTHPDTVRDHFPQVAEWLKSL